MPVPARLRRPLATLALGLAAAALGDALPVIGATPAAAQGAAPRRTATDRWQLTLDDDTVIWDIRLVALDGGTLRYRQREDTLGVDLEKVREIRLLAKSEMVMGQPMGGALNALTGADDEIFDLFPLTFEEKLATVRRILQRARG